MVSFYDGAACVIKANILTCFFLCFLWGGFFADLLKKEKILVDAKVYIFGMGMAQAFFKPKELPVLKQ